MKPKELLKIWVERFNQSDHAGLGELYSEDCINYQVPVGEVQGRNNIEKMFKTEFSRFTMHCIIENIFEEGNVGILEWRDPKGLRGCGFFWIVNNKIVYQRGYWDKQSFQIQQGVK